MMLNVNGTERVRHYAGQSLEKDIEFMGFFVTLVQLFIFTFHFCNDIGLACIHIFLRKQPILSNKRRLEGDVSDSDSADKSSQEEIQYVMFTYLRK